MKQNSFIKLRKNYYTHKSDSLSKKVKESIFGVIFVLLKDEESFELLDSVLFIFEFLEFMIFPFNSEVKSVWQNDALTDQINKVFSYLSLWTYLTNQSSAIYLTGLYTSILSITLVLFNIGYVSYSFSRKYFTFTWPLYVLRTVAKIFVTGLFMPLLELNLSIFYCEYNDESGQWLNSTSLELVCYNAVHFLHMGISWIVTILFIWISLFVAWTFFENSEKIGGESAKENSRADFAILISKVVSTFISTFFLDDNYQWFLIVINFSFSVFQVVKMYVDRPYYNFKQMALILCLNGIYMWSNFMLLICKIFSNYEFEGGFYIWLVGCPIWGFTFYCGSDESMRILSKGINLCKTGEEVQRHWRYFLTICEHLNQRDENNMTLQGYIFNHACLDQKCGICELKKLNISNNINHSNSSQNLSSTILNWNNSINNTNISLPTQTIKKYLYEYVENIYIKEISRYPNSTSLRIAYAMFLYEKKNDKAVALQQLSFAEKYNPLFDEEFIIYRYRKMINEENERLYHISNNDQFEEEEELDVVSSIAYDSHFRWCLHNIKRSAEWYINFWEKIINSSNQDLSTLNEMAVNINSANKNIEIHWKNMLEIKPNDPKAFKLYGGYIINVLNNKDKGNELVTIGYETSDKKPNSVGYLNFEIDEEYIHLAKEGNSFIFCSCEEEKTFGNIIKCSKTTMKFFGFTDKELMSHKNIKNLFLEFYQKSILDFIKAELDKNIDTVLQCKQYLMFIKHKLNNQPTYVIFKKYKGNYIKEKCFAVIFMADSENRENIKNYINNVYFIVDQDLKIKHPTQSATELIKKLGRNITEDSNFNKIFPEFEFDFVEINFHNNQNSLMIQAQNQFVKLNNNIGCKIKTDILEGYQSDENKNKFFMIKLQIITTDKRVETKNKSINIKPNFIYPSLSFFEKERGQKSLNSNWNTFSSPNPQMKTPEMFPSDNNKEAFSFYEFSHVEKPWNQNYFRGNMNESSDSSDISNDHSGESEEETDNNNYDDDKEDGYSEEIKDNVLPLTEAAQNESGNLWRNKQWWDGLTSEEFKKKLDALRNYSKKVSYFVIKIKSSQIEKLENVPPKISEILRDKKQALTVSDSFHFNRSNEIKNNYSSINQKNKVYKSVQKLSYFSFLIITSFCCYSLLDYFLNQSSITNIKTYYEMLHISFKSVEYFQWCALFLRNIILANNPLYTNLNGKTREDYIEYHWSKINDYITSLSEIYNNITKNSHNLLDDHEVLIHEETIPFLSTFENGELVLVNYTYLHAFQMQINLLLSILPIERDKIWDENDYSFEYFYNNFNEFMSSSFTSIWYFHLLIEHETTKYVVTNIIMFICNTIVCVCVVLFLYKQITSIELERTKVLQSFYKIQKSYLKSLAAKSRNFIQKIDKYIINSEDEENQNNSVDDDNSSNISEYSDKESSGWIQQKSTQDEDYNTNVSTYSSYSSQYSSGWSYLPKAIITTLFLILYFSATWSTNALSSKDTKAINDNFYFNSFYFCNATTFYNMICEKILFPDKEIFKTKSFDWLNSTFDNWSKLQTVILESNSNTDNIYNSEWKELLNSWQTGDFCDIQSISNEIEACDSKLNYISNFGGDIILSELLENLRVVLNDLFLWKDESDFDNRVKVWNSEHYEVMEIIIVDYLRVYFKVWNGDLFKFIIGYANSQLSWNTIMLAIYEVIIGCTFWFYWIPFWFSLKESIFQTQMMIDVIPEEIMSKINWNDNWSQMLVD